MAEPRPRVRVTASRRRVVAPPRDLAQQIHDQTGVGGVYLDDLVRAQRRLSLRVLFVGAVLLGALPLVFHLVPGTRTLTIAGMPFPWLVLGVLVYPVSVVVGRQYVRAAERLETEFTRMVERS